MEVAYANSARLVLAMPNAACAEHVGSLFCLHAFAGKQHHNVSTVRFTGVQPTVSLRSLPEKTTAVERSGGG